MAMYERLVSDLRSGKDGEQLHKTPAQIDYERQLDQMKLRFDKYWMRKPEPSRPLEGFNICEILGAGAFGKVVLVRHVDSDKYYAMKIQEKELLMKTKQVQHTLYEKRILQAVNYPFVVNMEFCFKDPTYIYFIMPFVNGGDLFTQLRRARKFQESHCKFYASQVVLALEYMHHLHLVYRDLKPENILLCSDGYLKITDFGFCKYVRTRTWTLCGTPDYLAPEIILSKGYGQSVDWWSFGVLVYEMAAGFAPFYDADQMVTYEKIVGLKYRYPGDFTMEIKDLIRNLLQVDLSRRYGILKKGVYDIKNHLFFKEIDWTHIFEKTVRPPFIPDCKHPGDTKYFDSCGEIVLTVNNYDKYEKEFLDF